MKKLLVIFALTLSILSGCNRQIIDTTWVYTYAKVLTLDGILEGEISSWRDYDQSDMIQAKFKDGTSVLTHSSNVILISGGNVKWSE